MISATLNEPAPLQVLAADGRQDLYARAKIYDTAGTWIASVPLPHLQDGLYGATWIPVIEGFFTAVYQLFFDADYLADAGYSRQGETIEVTETKTNILRLLGLVHENSIVDQQMWDSQGNLTSARVRSYDTKANAIAAGITGLRFIYSVNAQYSGGLLNKYEILRDQ